MNVKQQILDEITYQTGNRRHREAAVLSSLDAVAEEVAKLQSFYIASDDPGGRGNPGLVLYQTLSEFAQKEAEAGGQVEPWSIWLTEDVLAVAEASGLLDESIGTSAASAREWLQGDAKADQIRKQIAYLEGELSRIAEGCIPIWSGSGGESNDIPPGGALLTVEWAVSDCSYCEWYPSLEAAKAALLLVARGNHTAPDASGMNVDLSPEGAQFASSAYITRRDQARTCDHMLYARPDRRAAR